MKYILIQSVFIVLLVSYNSASYYIKTINFEAFKPTVDSGLDDTLFGFSLAYFAKENHKRLIISAPKADRVGKVYSCEVNANCTEWRIGEEENYIDAIRNSKFYQDGKPLIVDSWFGASLTASSSYVMACAPKLLTLCPENNRICNTNGKCYVNDDTTTTMIKLKDMIRADENLNVTSCASRINAYGWSSDIDDRGKFIVGSPGTHKSGALVYEGLTESLTAVPVPIYGEYHNLANNPGYSVAIGNFFLESETIYAIGSPYDDHGVGAVYFFRHRPGARRQPIKNNSNFYEHLRARLVDPGSAGSIFAAVLCKARLDGDGRSDLLVGAPAFNGGDFSMYEAGAVHVYYGLSPNTDIKPKWTIRGTQSRGRFGSAIANIGDIDGDKLDDIVIGAPDEQNGSGAVYLYPGSSFTGNKVPEPSQIIKPESTKHFGFSLAPLIEFDDIGRSGLAVGGFGERQVALLLQVPTFKVTISVTPPPTIRESDEDFKIHFCITFEFPRRPADISATIEKKLEIIHQHAVLKDSTGLPYSLKSIKVNPSNPRDCGELEVDKPTHGDYVSDPIMYIASVRQLNHPMDDPTFNGTQAILLDRPENKLQGTVVVTSDCASSHPDDCQPNLTVTMSSDMSEPFTIGSSDSEIISIAVANSKGTAYKACLKLTESEGVTLNRREYSLRRPLRKDDTWNEEAIIKTDRLTNKHDEVSVKVTVYANCTDPESGATTVFKRKLQYDTENVVLLGQNEAERKDVILNDQSLAKGRTLTHEYTLINNGKMIWTSLQCNVILESQDYLFYTNIEIYKDTTTTCKVSQGDNSSATTKVTCNLGDLYPGKKTNIRIPMKVKSANKILFYDGVNITSEMTIKDLKKGKRIQTVVKVVKTKVETWVWVLSAFMGIFMLCLIGLTLYKCGFLKRKKQEELKTLIRRESIRRQSLRLSVHAERMSRAASIRSRRNSYSIDAPGSSTDGQRGSVVADDLSSLCGSTTKGVHAEVHNHM